MWLGFCFNEFNSVSNADFHVGFFMLADFHVVLFILYFLVSKTKSNESKHGGSKLWDRHCEIRKSLKKKKKDKDSMKLDDASSTQSDMTDSRSSLTSNETGVGMMYKNVSSREVGVMFFSLVLEYQLCVNIDQHINVLICVYIQLSLRCF